MRRNERLSNATLTNDRVCTVLREKLYSMADNENQTEYKPLQLKWVFPVESTQGLISLYENIISVLGYVQKNECNRDTIDQIIENEIRSMVSGLSNEYDFFIATTIIIMCSMVDDFSDSDRLMKLVKEIIGKFIYLLGIVEHYISQEKDFTNINDTYWVNTSGLIIGLVVKNYKELCKILGEEVKNGKSKKLQLKNWERFFAWEKQGQRFIIVDIYDTPLPKEDLRKKGNNSIYKNYIELILLQYLSKQEN